jgi:hypothetical protein
MMAAVGSLNRGLRRSFKNQVRDCLATGPYPMDLAFIIAGCVVGAVALFAAFMEIEAETSP